MKRALFSKDLYCVLWIFVLLFSITCTAQNIPNNLVHFSEQICSPGPNSSTSGYFSESVDLNGDGNLDVLARERSYGWGSVSVSVRFGKGDGTFDRYAMINLDNFVDISQIIIGDYNTDDFKDFAVSTYDEKNSFIIVFLGDGDGTFTLESQIKLPKNEVNIEHADFNGDNIDDLLIARPQLYLVSLFIGDGLGSFIESASTTFDFLTEPLQLVKSDMNFDGKDDLVMSVDDFYNRNTGIYIIYGNINKNFIPLKLKESDSGQLAISDFNNDGILDIVSHNSPYLNVFLSDSNSNFSHLPRIKVSDKGYGYARPLVSDFNNDGYNDIILNLPDSITTLFGNGTGNFEASPSRYFDGTSDIQAGDLNNDGRTDLYSSRWCSELSGISVRLNTNLPSPRDQSLFYFPKSAGNGGDVSLRVSNRAISPGTSIKLVKKGYREILPYKIIYTRKFELVAIIDLRNINIGDYDLVITDITGNDQIILNGFKVKNFVKPDIWTQFTGSPFIRNGIPCEYMVQIGNRGNNDAVGVPVWISVTGEPMIKFTNKISDIDGEKID